MCKIPSQIAVFIFVLVVVTIFNFGGDGSAGGNDSKMQTQTSGYIAPIVRSNLQIMYIDILRKENLHLISRKGETDPQSVADAMSCKQCYNGISRQISVGLLKKYGLPKSL